jgi:hypothetical protein
MLLNQFFEERVIYGRKFTKVRGVNRFAISVGRRQRRVMLLLAEYELMAAISFRLNGCVVFRLGSTNHLHCLADSVPGLARALQTQLGLNLASGRSVVPGGS